MSVEIRVGTLISRLNGKKEKWNGNFKARANLITRHLLFKTVFRVTRQLAEALDSTCFPQDGEVIF